MARKTAKYIVKDDGRDKGKIFVITEMSSTKAEAWAYRALLALSNTGADLPDEFASLGMAGLAQIGLKGLTGLPWHVAEPLLNEMFECLQIMPDPKNPSVIRELEGDQGDYDIEEVSTRMKLRVEIWKLHTGFLSAVFPSLIEKVKGTAGKSSAIGTQPK